MGRQTDEEEEKEQNEDTDTVIERSTVDDHPPYAKLENVYEFHCIRENV